MEYDAVGDLVVEHAFLAGQEGVAHERNDGHGAYATGYGGDV